MLGWNKWNDPLIVKLLVAIIGLYMFGWAVFFFYKILELIYLSFF